mmetsp:Transcript_23440/g.54609  ORF Transcript_23440/g.54609 Transcript_23440/m.54609 type:complete len:207 (-) Transcript_23440:50-670(-)
MTSSAHARTISNRRQQLLSQVASLLEEYSAKLGDAHKSYDASSSSLLQVLEALPALPSKASAASVIAAEESPSGLMRLEALGIAGSPSQLYKGQKRRNSFEVKSPRSASEVLEESDCRSDAQLPSDLCIGFTDEQLTAILERGSLDGEDCVLAPSPLCGREEPDSETLRMRVQESLWTMVSAEGGPAALSTLLQKCLAADASPSKL